MAGNLPIDTVKQLLLQGKAKQISHWAREQGIQNIEGLIDAAARQLKNEVKK